MANDDKDFLNEEEQTLEDEEATSGSRVELSVPDKERPPRLCVLPIYGRPFLPSQVMPIQLAPKWEKTLRQALRTPSKMVALVNVPEASLEGELVDRDFARMACLVRIIQARIGEDVHFVAQGICRVKIKKINFTKSYIEANVEYPETPVPDLSSPEGIEIRAYAMSLIATMKELVPINPLYFEELKQYLARFNPNDPSLLADCCAAITASDEEKLQDILETVEILPRLKKALTLLRNELEVAKLQKNIKESVKFNLDQKQREFFLREQLKEIKKELGITVDEKDSVISSFQEAMAKLAPPEQVKEKFDEEIAHLSSLEPASAEYSTVRDYLKWLVSIPWGQLAPQNYDFQKAKKILEKDHEGLKDVKERILEFLALGAYKGQTEQGSILLFVGPPGVGKTSIGKSIAKALGRPFYRFSVGGLRDEAEIKGHRRTYVGALPGRFVQALKHTKVMNPVIMLDEIDKISSNSAHGDPSSALLETLDPEQNGAFLDHYLDVDLDLSKALFICTANTTETIPAPLLDRMDAIRISGYLANEKVAIAKKHLLPNILKKSNLEKDLVKIGVPVFKKIVEEYCRESGVRNLNKSIEKIVRKSVVKLMENSELKNVEVKPEDLQEYLGIAPFAHETTLQGVGIITGLAWTSMGGATLPVEAKLIDHSTRGFKLTGNLGQVMKESADIALSYVISNLSQIAPKADKDFFEKALIHLHVPEGATPKDGPSAGVTMASALVSLASGVAPKARFAMTGELSLTGHVLPIGGVREKIIAAKRQNINNIIVPIANKGDVEDLPAYVTEGVNFYYAEKYEDVANVLFDDLGNKSTSKSEVKTEPKKEGSKVKPKTTRSKAKAKENTK